MPNDRDPEPRDYHFRRSHADRRDEDAKDELRRLKEALLNLEEARHRGASLSFKESGWSSRVLVVVAIVASATGMSTGLYLGRGAYGRLANESAGELRSIQGELSTARSKLAEVESERDTATSKQEKAEGTLSEVREALNATGKSFDQLPGLVTTLMRARTNAEPQYKTERLQGYTESSAEHGSGWLNLLTATDFRKGERLRIVVGGDAKKVLVRLLSDLNRRDQFEGVLATPIDVINGIVEVKLKKDHPGTLQISVHGGAKPWGVALGRNNPGATLVSVDRLTSY